VFVEPSGCTPTDATGFRVRWGRDVVDHGPAPQARFVVKKTKAAKPVMG